MNTEYDEYDINHKDCLVEQMIQKTSAKLDSADKIAENLLAEDDPKVIQDKVAELAKGDWMTHFTVLTELCRNCEKDKVLLVSSLCNNYLPKCNLAFQGFLKKDIESMFRRHQVLRLS